MASMLKQITAVGRTAGEQHVAVGGHGKQCVPSTSPVFFRRALIFCGFVVSIITFVAPVAGFQGVLGVFLFSVISFYLYRRFPGNIGSLGSCVKYFAFGVTLGIDVVPLYQFITYCARGIEGTLLWRSEADADLEASIQCDMRHQYSIQPRCYEAKHVFPGAQYPRYRVIFWMHVTGATLALVLGLFLFCAPSRGAYRKVHRIVGRIYTVSVLAAASGAFWLGLTSEGGLVVNATFAVVSVFWFLSILVAVYFAVRRDIARHKAWVIRNYWGLTWGSNSLRWQLEFLYKGLKIPFHLAYPFAVVTSIIPVILAVEYYIHRYHYTASAAGDNQYADEVEDDEDAMDSRFHALVCDDDDDEDIYELGACKARQSDSDEHSTDSESIASASHDWETSWCCESLHRRKPELRLQQDLLHPHED